MMNEIKKTTTALATIATVAMLACSACSAQEILGEIAPSKHLSVMWLDKTTVVCRVRAPINTLARIEISEMGDTWKELNSVWTGTNHIELPAQGGEFHIDVRCYPSTGLKGSHELMRVVPMNITDPPVTEAESSTWITIIQTNTFWKSDQLQWRLRIQNSGDPVTLP